MSNNKQDDPPAYPGPQAPQAAHYGHNQHGNAAGGYGPQGGYYQSAPPMGYYNQPQQPGAYGPQGGYYGPQQHYGPGPHGYYQDNRRGPGCLEGLLAAAACCCCLECLF